MKIIKEILDNEKLCSKLSLSIIIGFIMLLINQYSINSAYLTGLSFGFIFIGSLAFGSVLSHRFNR